MIGIYNEDNKIVTRTKTFCFDLLEDIDQNLKHEIVFYHKKL